MTRRLAIAALVAWALAAGTARAQTAFGGDDSGFIPPDNDNYKCEKKVGKNVAKLLKCQSTCHQKRAQGKLPDTTTEEGCEDVCGTKYDTANGKITGCPPCQNPASMTSLGATMRSQGDSNNGLVY